MVGFIASVSLVAHAEDPAAAPGPDDTNRALIPDEKPMPINEAQKVYQKKKSIKKSKKRNDTKLPTPKGQGGVSDPGASSEQ